MVSLFAVPRLDAQQESTDMKIGGVDVATILERLGAKLENGISTEDMAGYDRHFGLVDSNENGRHSKVEYIDNGTYLTPGARRGIFNAADSDKDGFVTKAEYVLNRIITDEAKALVQAMDDNKDGMVQRAEFLKHAEARLSEAELARKVFDSLDTDANTDLVIPEYLRVWGKWARVDGKTPEQRLAVLTGEAEIRSARGRRGPPNGNARNFGPFSRNTEPVRLNRAGLKIGSPLPDISIFDADGNAFEMSSLRGKHTVLVFGCLT